MDTFKYILSEDLITCWETDLCQLLDDIKRDDSGQLRLYIRVQGIQEAATVLYEVLEDGLDNRVERATVYDEWYAFSVMRRRIYGRESLLLTSLKALELAVKQAEQRSEIRAGVSPIPDIPGISTEFQDQTYMHEGKYLAFVTNLSFKI
jgi:hypothetical protein